MTTKPETKLVERFRLPDPPPREIDEVTAFDHIYEIGDLANLALHFGNPEATLVTADRWIVASPEQDKSRTRRPDLLIAFNVSPEDYRQSNGYIVSEQGKAPDFVMEIASASTAEVDTGEKREYYAATGIPEYWRFDETGQFHGRRLAGDFYVPIDIREIEPGILEGCSEVLNLRIRWEQGRLRWIGPATGAPVPRHRETIARAERAEAERDRAREERDLARTRAEQVAEELRRIRENQVNP
jgi:Uma2 family endonuclease